MPVLDLAAESPHAYWLLYHAADLPRREVRTFVEWLRLAVKSPAASR